MTPLGTLIFSAIGALFVAGVAAALWWGMRDAGALDDALKRDGWHIERQNSGSTVRRIARRTRAGVAASIEVISSGINTKSVWTHVRVAADTGDGEVLIERKSPGFLAADGMLAAATGFTPPPRWDGAQASLAADHNCYASSESAAQRWLTAANQQAILAYNQAAQQRVSVRVFQGALEARWAREPADRVQLEGILALLESLRRQQKAPL